MRGLRNILLRATATLLLTGGIGDPCLLLFVSCMDSCWEGVNSDNCIINAKFHNINTYDVHIQCTAEVEDRDTGDRFGKVHHAELNGCLTNKYTNPFESLPMNMHNLKKLTLREFFVGELRLNDKTGPYLPKLEELVLSDNVITAYSSDFFNAQSVNLLSSIQFAGAETRTPTLDQLRPITDLRSLTIRKGDLLLDYAALNHLNTLQTLEIYSSRVTTTSPRSDYTAKSITQVILEDVVIANSSVLEGISPFSNITELRISNATTTTGLFNELNVSAVINSHPKLSMLTVQRQNLSTLIIDLKLLTNSSQLMTMDISYNDLDEIEWNWDPNLVQTLVNRFKFKIIIDHNPWQCEFFQKCNDADIFEYEKDYNSINVRGIKCTNQHNATKWGKAHQSRPLDLNNMWLLYGCVLSSLLLIISVTYLVCAICRSKRREPFYRSLAKWRKPTTRSVPDMTMRKLPATTYETPLQYRTIEFKSEDNCEIYEEIPANVTGQTLQVII